MKKKSRLRKGSLERQNEVIRIGFSKECKTELIQALRKIFDDKDFVLGVLCDLGSDNDIQAVLDYIDNHNDVNSEDIILLSLRIAEANAATPKKKKRKALNLSKTDREWLEADLHAAEPYDPDDPILGTFDADFDNARFRATMAKRFLEQDDREKVELAQEQQERKGKI